MVSDLYSITVDDREQKPSPAERVNELLALGVPASVGRLGVGDYQWLVSREDGSTLYVVVERKAISDLLSSATDGRLSRFIDETGGVEPSPELWRILLVEGDQFVFGNYGYKEWTPESVDNVLVSMQSLGVTVIRSSSAKQTARRLAAFWEYSGRDEHTSLLRVVRPEVTGNYLKPGKKQAVRAIMGLPGWGEQRARAALEGLGSVEAVFQAVMARDYKAFKNVDGVGKGLVENGAQFLEEKHG